MPFSHTYIHLCTPMHMVSWLKAQAEVIELSLKIEKCLQIGVFFFLEIHRTGSRHPVTRRRTSLLASPLIQLFLGFCCFFVMGQHYIDTSAPPIFALDFAEAIVHIQVKWVYAGAPGPHPWVTSADFSHTYLPVKSFIPLITGQWLYQQTASGVFSTCFLHRLYGLLYK